MTDPLPEDIDRRLEILLRDAAAPLPDAGFSDAVMGRIARTTWRRRLLLGAAAAVGIAVAGGPALEMALALGERLAVLGGRWGEVGSLVTGPVALVVGLVAMAAPGVMQALED